MQDTDSDRPAATGWTGGHAAPMPTASSVVTLTTLATITGVCIILSLARDLFLPLALGMLFAFILTPLVNFLRRRGLHDGPAVVLTVTIAVLVVAAFLVILGYQFGQIATNLPKYQSNILGKVDSLLDSGKDSRILSYVQSMVDNISNRLADQTNPAARENIQQVEVVERSSLSDILSDVILPVLSPVAIFGIIAVITFFALFERAALRDRLVQLIGGTNIVVTSRLLDEAGTRVSSYLLAQVVLNVIYAVPIGLGLWLIGVPNALFFGLVTMVMRFVPYFGSAISAILPLTMAFAISPGWSMVLWTAGLFLVVETATSNIIEPWFYGQRTGLSPLSVILSAFFWTWLWGPMGLIIATPLTVCLVVIGSHVPRLRLFPILLGDMPTLSGPAQLYDRLLAGNRLAFTEAATQATTDRYLAEFYDQTAIPALARAQADHEAGLLSDATADRIALAAWHLTEELEQVVEDELSRAETPPDAAAPNPAKAGSNLSTNGLSDGAGHSVVVLGARSALEDAAAMMLAQVLRAEGADAIALPQRAALPASLAGFVPRTAILVSLEPAAGPMLDRQLRLLKRRLPALRRGAVLFPEPDAPDADAPHDRASETAAAAARLPSADFVALGVEAALKAAFSVPPPSSDPLP